MFFVQIKACYSAIFNISLFFMCFTLNINTLIPYELIVDIFEKK